MVTTFLQKKIKESTICCDYVQYQDDISESAFIAHRCEKELTSAVSATAICNTDIDYGLLEEAVTCSRLIVVEANLRQHQIEDIMFLAARLSKPVFAAAVSEKKVERLLPINRENGFKGVTMNAAEEKALVARLRKGSVSAESVDLCHELGAETIFITDGAAGYSVLMRGSDKRLHYRAPPLDEDDIKSSSGAGDAVLSAVIHQFYHDGSIGDLNKSKFIIWKYVSAVLTVPESTIASHLDLDDILQQKPETNAADEDHFPEMNWYEKLPEKLFKVVLRRVPKRFHKVAAWVCGLIIVTLGLLFLTAHIFGIIDVFEKAKEFALHRIWP